MTDTDRRIERLEGTVDRVVTILEGESVHDIAGNLIGSEGGIVKQGERNAEALHGITRQLDGIQTQLKRPRWTRGQRIAASGVAVMFLVGVVPVVAWSF